MNAVVANDCTSYLAEINFNSDYGLLLMKNSFLMYVYIFHSNLAKIELHKLLGNSSNDIYRLKSFFGKLKPTGKYSELGIELSVIQDWEQRLKKHRIFIAHMSELRNKVYAHTDRVDISNMASIQETNQVIDLVKEIVTNVYQRVFETDKQLDHFIYGIGVPVNNLKRIVAKLIEDYHLNKNE